MPFNKYNDIYLKFKLKSGLTAIFLSVVLHAQAQLFDSPKNIALVRTGIDYIYNIQPDSAELYIVKLEHKLPNHPCVPMLRALNVLWTHIPVVSVDSVFRDFSQHLRECIRLSAHLDGGRQEHPEAIFFEMSARGLLAEYYADAGQYMKALSEAGKAYDLIKSGFELTDQVPDFLLTTGVYNYFREKYPEKHPVYKPLLWFFRAGDVELGLAQITAATERALLTQVEAYVYLAYIYLRYEYKPEKAQRFLWELAKKYPNNFYIKAKLLESLTPKGDFEEAPMEYIKELKQSDRPYYQLAGNSFYGLYLEQVTLEVGRAADFYRKALASGSQIVGHGTYYKSLAHLGLGRIAAKQGDTAEAEYHYEQVLEITETDTFRKKAERLLKML
ncbi:tetratricopeptide repeat protein [Marinoscillum furvescens]|uniref:tetratricopeptide repeat protein n=1 Tax=Marinoscillum furvescens TaxID=1026 RepID=UPI0014749795|nr:tetratricopeptide repeat protein [Marinoscillum furvescens]